MNTLSKEYYRRKRKQQLQTKIFNIIMILSFLFMLAFSIQMVRKANQLQKQLTEQVK
jgi:hypothetical protein